MHVPTTSGIASGNQKQRKSIGGDHETLYLSVIAAVAEERLEEMIKGRFGRSSTSQGVASFKLVENPEYKEAWAAIHQHLLKSVSHISEGLLMVSTRTHTLAVRFFLAEGEVRFVLRSRESKK